MNLRDVAPLVYSVPCTTSGRYYYLNPSSGRLLDPSSLDLGFGSCILVYSLLE